MTVGIATDDKGFLVFREPTAGERVNPSGVIVAKRQRPIAPVPSRVRLTHSEPLTDGAGNFIFMGGDVIVCTGVPD